jgi:hypothetical protein
VLSVVGWEGLVVACCMPGLRPVSIILSADIISLLVPGVVHAEEVLALQEIVVASLGWVCIEVAAVARRWVYFGFVFVVGVEYCSYYCCFCYYCCIGFDNCCVIGIGVVSGVVVDSVCLVA